MNPSLAARIRDTQVEPGSLALFWLGQAGFVYKLPGRQVIYIDPYLTDSVHRQLGGELYGFRRIMMSPMTPDEVEADWVVCTHAHADHLDLDLMPTLAGNPRTRFAGASDCRAGFADSGVPAERMVILTCGQTVDLGAFKLTGVYADHGELAPEALGIVLEAEGIKVWQVGDSAYRPDMWGDLFTQGIDILIPPINGAYGNLNGTQAAQLAGDAGVKVAIPCHFWMFPEHGGSPAEFLDACKTLAPGVQPQLMGQGERFIYRKSA